MQKRFKLILLTGISLMMLICLCLWNTTYKMGFVDTTMRGFQCIKISLTLQNHSIDQLTKAIEQKPSYNSLAPENLSSILCGGTTYAFVVQKPFERLVIYVTPNATTLYRFDDHPLSLIKILLSGKGDSAEEAYKIEGWKKSHTIAPDDYILKETLHLINYWR